jgi:hypothetical protein
MDNIVACPECGHGAAFHENGQCKPLSARRCSCTISAASICERVLVRDRVERERDLDAYLSTKAWKRL